MNSRMPNLRHLRAFGAVVRCRSISKASEVVHLSQPAVTQAIANL
ncbi:MAG: LysR family transcriptional regulator, partial [Rhodospirillaceae bacterium]|nr:LysR family transcriptional regulator [Rhodospirillaceae bacterium]